MLTISVSLKMKHLLFLLWILSITILSFGIKLITLWKWKYVDFDWEYPEDRQKAINSGSYIVNACVLYNVDKALDGRIFVTSVRDEGVPASLMTVTNKMGEGGPPLRPYPNWSWYKNNDCDKIISVFQIKCNHLFVLNCGIIGENKICPAKLLIFNLKNDLLVKKVVIPEKFATNSNGTGLLVTPLVNIQDCRNIDDATVYMADIQGYGLVVWNMQRGFCRFESKYTKPTDPIFTMPEQSFYLNGGIFGLTLIDKKLYYAALAGDDIYKIDTWIIQKCELAGEINELTQVMITLTGQTAPIASEDCAIFFSNIPQTFIMCADTSKKIPSTMEIIMDDVKLQFPSGMKVKHRIKQSALMILTNRFQRVMSETLDLNEINFRILSIDL